MSTTNENRRLQQLSGSDYEIADGQCDIRGWDVYDSANKQIGEVDELIFDPVSRKVRYLVLDTDDNDYKMEERLVLVPIGVARLHEEDDDVVIPNITTAQIMGLPEYDDDMDLQPAHEHQIRTVFAPPSAEPVGVIVVDDDFYTHEHFDDKWMYRDRK